MKVLRRRVAVVAASLALFATIAAPGRARSPDAPAAASPTQPPAEPSRTERPATPFADVFAQLAGRLVGVVVNISTQAAPPPAKTAQEAPQNSPGTTLDDVFRDFLGEKGATGVPGPRIASLGSGFIIDPAGLIVTNNHVIANAEQITVTLSDDTSLQAKVIGRDAVTDLALLKVDAKTPLPAASWGEFEQGAGRRLGSGDRQPVRSRRHGDLGDHLGNGARHPFEPL